jgi:hypothetical protein
MGTLTVQLPYVGEGRCVAPAGTGRRAVARQERIGKDKRCELNSGPAPLSFPRA